MAILISKWRAFLLLAWLAAAMGSRSAAQVPEYDIKAAMILNFAQFVQWPAPPASQTNFVIGILGRDPFGEVLDRLVKGEKVGDRPVVIKRYRSVAEAGHAQILFVAASEEKNWPRILRDLEGKPILTVGDMEDFARRGGMIRLFLEQNKVRFRINHEQAKKHQLAISSKLLRLADIVETTRE